MKMYLVTINKTTTMQMIVDARNPIDAGLLAKEQLMNTDETAYIRNAVYSPAEVEEVEQ